MSTAPNPGTSTPCSKSPSWAFIHPGHLRGKSSSLFRSDKFASERSTKVKQREIPGKNFEDNLSYPKQLITRR